MNYHSPSRVHVLERIANTTQQDHECEPTTDAQRVPGIVVVYTNGLPVLWPYPLRNAGLRIGRERGDVTIDDGLLSRAHAEVIHTGTEWIVRDLNSRNGTFVNGARVSTGIGSAGLVRLECIVGEHVVRIGHTLLLLCDDVRPFQNQSVQVDGDFVFGPRMRSLLAEIADIGGSSTSLHINGASGSGKELAARRFHDSSPRRAGPFIAVNCAAIPGQLAERLLFGTVKGAYSGAEVDAEGYVCAANGGTLFLDEIAELDLMVQAKLLRVLETREVVPLGASRTVPVDVQICSATHRELRDAVAENLFREDLYYRLALPSIWLLPLRERREEIPSLVKLELAKVDASLTIHPLFVEACLNRHWPGNVRELRREVANAGRHAASTGSQEVQSRMLNEAAGTSFAKPIDTVQAKQITPRQQSRQLPDRNEILDMLDEANWNVTGLARTLGVHRNQLRRWLKRLAIERPLR